MTDEHLAAWDLWLIESEEHGRASITVPVRTMRDLVAESRRLVAAEKRVADLEQENAGLREALSAPCVNCGLDP